jgi:hypothetical protein
MLKFLVDYNNNNNNNNNDDDDDDDDDDDVTDNKYKCVLICLYYTFQLNGLLLIWSNHNTPAIYLPLRVFFNFFL